MTWIVNACGMRHILGILARCAFGCSVAALPTLIMAQPAVPRQYDDWGGKASVADSRADLRSFGICAARLRPDAAKHLLATMPGSKAEEKLASRLASNSAGCLGDGALQFQATALRGGVAEGLLRAKAPPSLLAMPLPSTGSAKTDEKQRGLLLLFAFATCVVKADPLASRELLGAEPSEPNEVAAFRRLGTSMGNCFPEGASFKIDRGVLRGMLAEASLHIGSSAQPADVAANSAGKN